MVARGNEANASVVNLEEMKGRRRRAVKPQKHSVKLVFDSKSYHVLCEMLEESKDGSFTVMFMRAVKLYDRLNMHFNLGHMEGISGISAMEGFGTIYDMIIKSLEITGWLKKTMKEQGFDKVVLLNSETGEAVEADIDL